MAPAQDSAFLYEGLQRSEHSLAAVIPVLRHLLVSEGPSLVNEAVVARVRGMLDDLARQAYFGKRPAAGPTSAAAPVIEDIANRLADDSSLLAHIHTLALESQLAERFEQRLSLDPVLSPLMQELIASDDSMIAELAMNTLSAQARFIQGQRRMELPLVELPADLLGTVIRTAEDLAHPGAAGPMVALRATYDEAATRLALLERLVGAMRRAAVACLAFDRAGLALFASGLARLSGQMRAKTLMACSEQQGPRLALALRAAGLDGSAIERQGLLIGAGSNLGTGIDAISPAEARRYLQTCELPAAGRP
ncbi:MAG: hypothetical protein ACXIT4_08610 [Erythrobacter sp.]